MNWTRDEVNPGEDFILSADGSVFTEGTKSLHMTLKTGAVPYLVSDVFYITPGAEYEFSVDVFDNDTSGQVKVYADFYDTYGFDIFGETPVFSQDSSEWQTISWQGTIPMQAVVGYVLVKFHTQPDLYHFTKQAETWIDNAQFRQSDGINILANGGFEDWQVGLEDHEKKSDFLTVYPNPACDKMNLIIPSGSSALAINDMTGRVVYSQSLSGTECIYQADLSGLSSGNFIITVFRKDNSALRGKFVKKSDF